jgi:uncharacterized lipoprotein YbaY
LPENDQGNVGRGADVVEGELRFPADAVAFRGAIARVTLLDVTRADAPARTVAEQAVANVTHPGGEGQPVVFTLRLQQRDPRARYVVRAHVDVNGDGRVSRGDYISAESYPVLTFGHSNRVVVRLRSVA